MATGCWADLNSEFLVSIASSVYNGSSLRDYTSLRGVCTAWRSALASPYPCLLSLAHDRASVFSLPMRRRFHLCTAAYSTTLDDESRDMGICSRARVVGSGNGRFAVAIDYKVLYRTHRVPYHRRRKISHGHDCFWTERILLLSPCTGEKVQLFPPGRHGYDCVDKIVFSPSPNDETVVAMYDQKKVAYVDTTRDKMKWTTLEVVSGFTENLVDLVFDDVGGRKVYCLDTEGVVRVLDIPAGGRNNQEAAVEPSLTTLLSAPVLVQPFHIASAKNLFFWHGRLYQVWQNTSVTVSSDDGSTMFADEMFVLRHNPGRWSHSWEEVNDLGGCSVFVGKNNSPAVARAGAVPGVLDDCVYWIDWRGVPMVCDMATRTSKPCALPYGAGTGICWYFGVDNMRSIEPSTGTGKIKRPVYTSGDCGKRTGPTWSPRPTQRRRLALERVEAYNSMDYWCNYMKKIAGTLYNLLP